MNRKDKKLGMDRPITRRDFVGGVSMAIGAGLAGVAPNSLTATAGQPQQAGIYYPPTRTGLRGSHPGSFEVAHQMRDGTQWDLAADSKEEESYDLVVVGGGLSGLAAAWFYREARPDARILILDNHDDFGGHAKRNEFWHGEQLLLSHGGTINIEDFTEYGPDAQRLIRSLGIKPERFQDYDQRELYRSLGLKRGVFFDRATFGVDQLVTGVGKPNWEAFLARTPLSEVARRDIAALMDTRKDYLAGLSPAQKQTRLRAMSYEDYLLEIVGLQPESLAMLRNDGYWAIGIDALSAWSAALTGQPGTLGLGLRQDSGEDVYFRFPDGNASIARLLVRSLVDGVAPGSTMEDVVTARFDYGKLDRAGTSVRIRLNSTVVDVRHEGNAETAREVLIKYVRDGRAYQVRAASTVLACYNSVIPYLCNELPAEQRTALSQSLKAPLIYTSVLVRNWKALARLGIYRVDCPGSYFKGVRLADPISIGDYRHARSPEDAIVLNLYRTPLAAGLSAQEQWRAGRRELLSTPFERFEREIRDQLGRMLGAGGFDPARDIEAITVNRWPHGYAYGQNPDTGEIAYMLDEVPPEKAPWLQARKPFGRIAIANSDAAANAMTEGAIGEAHRAVTEILAMPA